MKTHIYHIQCGTSSTIMAKTNIYHIQCGTLSTIMAKNKYIPHSMCDTKQYSG